MNTNLTRAFFDACHRAKRITKCLPPLPEWMTPRQIHVIDAIHALSQSQETVRPSDIANHLDGTMPSITRMLGELERHNVVQSIPDENDRRSHTLVLTPYGKKIYLYYIEQFNDHIAELFTDISEEDMLTTIAVIEKAYTLLNEDQVIKEDRALL